MLKVEVHQLLIILLRRPVKERVIVLDNVIERCARRDQSARFDKIALISAFQSGGRSPSSIPSGLKDIDVN